MGFNDLTTTNAPRTLARFANADVSVTLAGVGVRTFRAIFDQVNEPVSIEMQQTNTKPSITCLSADMAGVTGSHVLDITRDADGVSRQYKFDGKPRPDGAGFTLVYLGRKV
jgi:hypothetical protein